MTRDCSTCQFCEPYDQWDAQPMCSRGANRHAAGFAFNYLCKGQHWVKK